ncbi:MAG: hypothetical protein J1F20_04915 [Muribaculaceae bacterium]|nr:hypothetical protein [Muribaculaceae bacterium]
MKEIDYLPIEEKSINDRLINLYGTHLVGLYSEMEKIYHDPIYDIKPAAPLLIELSDDEDKYPYESAELRVMVFGRENNNWNDKGNRGNAEIYTQYSTYNFHLENTEDILTEIRGKHTDDSENELLPEQEMYGLTDIYHDYCFEETGVAKNQFTKRMYQFIEMLEQKTGKQVGCVWNNLFKIGRGKVGFGGCCAQSPDYIKDIEKRTFDVIGKEIEILKPDIIIFMTGIEVDDAIVEKLNLPSGEFPIIDASLPHLRKVVIPGVKYAARTIHPSRKSNEIFNKYCAALIEDIIQNI